MVPAAKSIVGCALIINIIGARSDANSVCSEFRRKVLALRANRTRPLVCVLEGARREFEWPLVFPPSKRTCARNENIIRRIALSNPLASIKLKAAGNVEKPGAAGSAAYGERR